MNNKFEQSFSSDMSPEEMERIEALKKALAESRTLQELNTNLIDFGVNSIKEGNRTYFSDGFQTDLINILWGGKDAEGLVELRKSLPNECGFADRVFELGQKYLDMDGRHAEHIEADFEKEISKVNSVDEFMDVIKMYGGVRVRREDIWYTYYTYGQIKSAIENLRENIESPYIRNLPEEYGVREKLLELIKKEGGE